MKFSVCFIFGAMLLTFASAQFQGINWRTMENACIENTQDQIKKEMSAAFQYLSMAAYFSKDSVNLPGFANFFFKSASEEREHGIKLMEYLAMRGYYTNDADNLNFSKIVQKSTLEIADKDWKTGLEAMKGALQREASVTQSIVDLIKKCEGGNNDYHLVDYLTGEYLEEQYHGQREIAGMISTLSKLDKTRLGEYMFDKKLL